MLNMVVPNTLERPQNPAIAWIVKHQLISFFILSWVLIYFGPRFLSRKPVAVLPFVPRS